MTTFAWPSSQIFWTPKSFDFGPYFVASQAESIFTGDIQSASRPNTRWAVKMSFASATYRERSQIDGFLNRLQGQMHRVQMGHLARPAPYGTVSLTTTLASATAQFSVLIPLYGMGVSKTLLAGDLFSVATSSGVQLCMCAIDAVSTPSGTATIEITQPLRGSIAAATPVTFQAPTTLWMLKDPNATRASYEGGNLAPDFDVEFVEAFR